MDVEEYQLPPRICKDGSRKRIVIDADRDLSHKFIRDLHVCHELFGGAIQIHCPLDCSQRHSKVIIAQGQRWCPLLTLRVVKSGRAGAHDTALIASLEGLEEGTMIGLFPGGSARTREYAYSICFFLRLFCRVHSTRIVLKIFWSGRQQTEAGLPTPTFGIELTRIPYPHAATTTVYPYES